MIATDESIVLISQDLWENKTNNTADTADKKTKLINTAGEVIDQTLFVY